MKSVIVSIYRFTIHCESDSFHGRNSDLGLGDIGGTQRFISFENHLQHLEWAYKAKAVDVFILCVCFLKYILMPLVKVLLYLFPKQM